jgi:hypothetical protein
MGKYTLNILPRAAKGIVNIKRSGDSGRLRQMKKALAQLEADPRHPSLNSHKAGKNTPAWTAKFGRRDDLWISYIRTGPGGERVVWAFGEKSDKVEIIDIEYIGPHLD